MKKQKKRVCLFAMGCILVVTGCSPAINAITKFQSGDIGAITETEWESLAGLGTSFGLPIPPVTPTQAKAIVDFLKANNIETTQDLESLLASGNVTVPPELAELFK